MLSAELISVIADWSELVSWKERIIALRVVAQYVKYVKLVCLHNLYKGKTLISFQISVDT